MTFVDTLALATAEDLQIPCAAGSYNSQLYAASQSDCQDCPPGKYCLGGEQSYSGLCDEGYVCTIGNPTATPGSGTGTVADMTDTSYSQASSGLCPKGYYCPRGSSFPIPCPAGQYQDETG